ncbi:MAG: hypothetical protein ACF8PG_13550 [Maioricimonas sp. JB045]|uniref:hypothetical protein n=1 Tax=Maioricimonas sp. JC845 TaxID=3232138 RepID=UPI003459842C
MIRNVSVALTVASAAIVSLTLAGCTGGDSVEDQERFQLDRTAASATADQIRGMVSGLSDSMQGEGMESLKYAVQSAAENLDSIDTSTLEGDAKDKADQIKTLMSDLASKVESGGSAAEAREILQQMTDLANQLPGGSTGGGEGS